MYYACCCLKINPLVLHLLCLRSFVWHFRWLYKHFFNVKLLRASYIHIHYKAISISCGLLVMPYKNYKTTPYCICPCSSRVYFKLYGIQKPNSWTYNFAEVSGHNLESSQTWCFHIPTMFVLQTSFKPHLLKGGGE